MIYPFKSHLFLSCHSISEAVEKPESTDATEVQEAIAECMKKDDDVGEAVQNGLRTHAPVEKPESAEKLELVLPVVATSHHQVELEVQNSFLNVRKGVNYHHVLSLG